MTKLHLVITGGHHNSALVVAKKLQRLGHRVSWLGSRFAARGDRHDSAEYREVTEAGPSFYHLQAGKLGSGPLALAKIPLGVGQAWHLLNRLRPDLVLSFGSYLGLAVAVAARLRGLPVFLHEQTVTAGLANQLIAPFARRLYLTWDSSRAYFPAAKSLLTGLPLRSSLLKAKPTLIFNNSLPTILVMGGKQGSHTINQVIFANLPALLTDYNLIHQTGTSSITGDLPRAKALARTLSPSLASRYQPVGYLTEKELGKCLKACDLYLGRSGAHITYELAVLGVKGLLIPFLHTRHQEQLKNARLLASHHLAAIIPEQELSLHTLQQLIPAALKRPAPQPLPLPTDAAQVIVQDLLAHATAL